MISQIVKLMFITHKVLSAFTAHQSIGHRFKCHFRHET